MSDTCTEGNYTPGPWGRFKRTESQLGQTRWQIEEKTGMHPYWIAQVINEADARLIAAAPDLLKACQKVVEHYGDPAKGKLFGLRAAIAKATGEKQTTNETKSAHRRKSFRSN